MKKRTLSIIAITLIMATFLSSCSIIQEYTTAPATRLENALNTMFSRAEKSELYEFYQELLQPAARCVNITAGETTEQGILITDFTDNLSVYYGNDYYNFLLKPTKTFYKLQSWSDQYGYTAENSLSPITLNSLRTKLNELMECSEITARFNTITQTFDNFIITYTVTASEITGVKISYYDVDDLYKQPIQLLECSISQSSSKQFLASGTVYIPVYNESYGLKIIDSFKEYPFSLEINDSGITAQYNNRKIAYNKSKNALIISDGTKNYIGTYTPGQRLEIQIDDYSILAYKVGNIPSVSTVCINNETLTQKNREQLKNDFNEVIENDTLVYEVLKKYYDESQTTYEKILNFIVGDNEYAQLLYAVTGNK